MRSPDADLGFMYGPRRFERGDLVRKNRSTVGRVCRVISPWEYYVFWQGDDACSFESAVSLQPEFARNDPMVDIFWIIENGVPPHRCP